MLVTATTIRSRANLSAPVIFQITGYVDPADGATLLTNAMPVNVARMHWKLTTETGGVTTVGAEQEGVAVSTITPGAARVNFVLDVCIHPRVHWAGTITNSAVLGATTVNSTAVVADKADIFCRTECWVSYFNSVRAQQAWTAISGPKSENLMDRLSNGYAWPDIVTAGGPSVVSMSFAANVLTLNMSDATTRTVTIPTSSSPNRVNVFVPTAGQTVFTLAPAPTDSLSVEVSVNGASYDSGSGFFTIAGSTVTWTGPYGLTTTDTVSISYI